MPQLEMFGEQPMKPYSVFDASGLNKTEADLPLQLGDYMPEAPGLYEVSGGINLISITQGATEVYVVFIDENGMPSFYRMPVWTNYSSPKSWTAVMGYYSTGATTVWTDASGVISLMIVDAIGDTGTPFIGTFDVNLNVRRLS